MVSVDTERAHELCVFAFVCPRSVSVADEKPAKALGALFGGVAPLGGVMTGACLFVWYPLVGWNQSL